MQLKGKKGGVGPRAGRRGQELAEGRPDWGREGAKARRERLGAVIELPRNRGSAAD